MVAHWLDFSDLDSPSDPYAEYAIDTASFILWSLSGRKYTGVRTTTEQYVCPEYDTPTGCYWENERVFVNAAGGFNGFVVPSHLVQTHQSYGTRFRLRRQPVRKIHEISIGGQILPSGSYYIRNRAEAVIEPAQCGGLCDGPLVTYTYGVPPPSAGKLAAIELANELILDYNGDGACNLPSRISDIQRQGISIQIYDPQEFLDKGRLGLFKVDLFLASVNPGRALKPARVVSPDMPRGYHRSY